MIEQAVERCTRIIMERLMLNGTLSLGGLATASSGNSAHLLSVQTAPMQMTEHGPAPHSSYCLHSRSGFGGSQAARDTVELPLHQKEKKRT